MRDIVAIIPCRAGSKRVKNKNFRPFCGSTLLDIKIEMVKQLPVKRIIVNTDSQLAQEIAKKHGIESVKRPAYFASSKCSNSQYHEYLGNSVSNKNVLIAQVTSPMVEKDSYFKAINMFYNQQVDSLISVTSFKNFIIHNGVPLN